MITETDVLALGCILLALACAGLAIYAWQEHVQCSVNRIRAEEQATWADHFQTALDECANQLARQQTQAMLAAERGNQRQLTADAQRDWYNVTGAQFDDVPAGWDQSDWSAQ